MSAMSEIDARGEGMLSERSADGRLKRNPSTAVLRSGQALVAQLRNILGGRMRDGVTVSAGGVHFSMGLMIAFSAITWSSIEGDVVTAFQCTHDFTGFGDVGSNSHGNNRLRSLCGTPESMLATFSKS
jgi:hypothetical protein